MITRLAQSAGVVTAALLYVAATTAMAEEKIRITGFYVDEIDVYDDADGLRKQKKSVKSDQVDFPIEVIQVSPNYMMKVDSGKLKGWIYATIVKTEGDQFESSDVGPCNHAVPEAYAALRNVGNQCVE